MIGLSTQGLMTITDPDHI
jgi:hypothetical protein